MMRLLFCFCLFSAAAIAQQGEFVRITPGIVGDVRIDHAFRMAKTEVTVREFAAFVKATGYRTAAELEGAARTWRAPGFKLSAGQPVVYVTPEDAAAYCSHISGRLPTDAEWEYSARAGAATRHYWGDTIDSRYLWYRPNSGGRPHKVGSKLPNRWGLYDMEGNVWEWTVAEPVEGRPWANRRGGSWIDCAEFEPLRPEPGREPSPLISLSISFKIFFNSRHRYDDIGFRCVLPED
jgi:formylglycine-generating enzyme required for sulfatase activity